MKQIKNEKALLTFLLKDIKTSTKDAVFFLAGHFPLVYKEEGAIEDFHIWGKFSLYTLELACILAQKAKSLGKVIKFIFLVDDHIYEDGAPIGIRSIKIRRKNLYQKRSGELANLPKELKKIMKKYSFDEEDVLRHNHKKFKRKNCLYFAEKILRKSKRKIINPCSREYAALFEDEVYFNKEKNYLIAFIPSKCKNSICNIALDNEIKKLSASHIFIETRYPSLSKKELFTKTKIHYRKD